MESASQLPTAATLVIAGAGSVGMCLAIDAGLRGIDVLVLERRAADEKPGAKCNTVAARTMESFRRLGVAAAVRAAGLPDDYPTDVIYCASLAGHELMRIPLPSRTERDNPGYIDSDWATPEPMVRVSQLYLEPILYARMTSMPGVRVVHETEVIGYEQDPEGVDVLCHHDGATVRIRALFLAGCDGGRSAVRKAMNVALVGDAEIGRTRTSLVRAPAIRALFGTRRPAWMSWVANPRVRGNVVAIDGESLWLLHRSLRGGVTDFESLDFDQSIRDLLGVDAEFDYEVLGHEDWVGRRLVAQRFRDRRVFIAGDAAHLWVPFAGYGMNAGIADALSLSWMLCAVLRGWAAPALLDAYEAERLPITDQVSRLAIGKVMENAVAMGSGPVPALVESDTPEGAAMREVTGQRLYAINVPQFAPAGLNFGYYYEASPVIVYDDEPAPEYDMGRVVASTSPGCRLPHFRTLDGTSVYDLLGPDYSLLRFAPDVSVQPLLAAATTRVVPLRLVDLRRPQPAALYRHHLLIVRCDQHIAWRGDALPADVDALLDRLSAHGETR